MLEADLSLEQSEIEGRSSLRPHQGRSDQLISPEGLEAIGTRHRGHRRRRVDHERQRRPRRASCSSATQFG